MAVETPDTSVQVEQRIKADVQRSAPDSNPYLTTHWLRSLIAGVARRIFDFYTDLRRTEERVVPDTADPEFARKWGNIYIGAPLSASKASGRAVMTGVAGGLVGVGETMTAGGNEYEVTAGGSISASVVAILSITRSGATATVTVVADRHNLASAVPVTIAGATQPEYNVAGAVITVTGLNTFTYQVAGAPATPATGTITAAFTAGYVTIQSTGFGSGVNLAADTPLSLTSPIVNVDDALHVAFDAVGGGTDEESLPDYQERYLDKIRNPISHFSVAEIDAVARAVPGVTRTFIYPAGSATGAVSVSSLTRAGNVAAAVTTTPHGLEDGMVVTVAGAIQAAYNVQDERVLVFDATTFYYLVSGAPATPATGTILASTRVPLGQVVTYFTRDNDADGAIPTASEVAEVKAALDGILPANTQSLDNIVLAPVAVPTNYVFTSISPDTLTMRAAVGANLRQFHAERVDVGVSVATDAYRAAIQNTIDPDTGDELVSFVLSSPAAPLTVSTGQLATFGSATF